MTDPAPIPSESAPKKLTRREIVTRLRGALEHADPGMLAALRRYQSGGRVPAAFYKLMNKALPEDALLTEEQEARWAPVVCAMAGAKGFLGDVRLGEALAKAGVAELRVLRLLEADAAQLPDLVGNVVHMLVQKGQVFDPYELANLLLAADDDRRPRSAIAHSYYRHADQ